MRHEREGGMFFRGGREVVSGRKELYTVVALLVMVFTIAAGLFAVPAWSQSRDPLKGDRVAVRSNDNNNMVDQGDLLVVLDNRRFKVSNNASVEVEDDERNSFTFRNGRDGEIFGANGEVRIRVEENNTDLLKSGLKVVKSNGVRVANNGGGGNNNGNDGNGNNGNNNNNNNDVTINTDDETSTGDSDVTINTDEDGTTTDGDTTGVSADEAATGEDSTTGGTGDQSVTEETLPQDAEAGPLEGGTAIGNDVLVPGDLIRTLPDGTQVFGIDQIVIDTENCEITDTGEGLTVTLDDQGVPFRIIDGVNVDIRQEGGQIIADGRTDIEGEPNLDRVIAPIPVEQGNQDFSDIPNDVFPIVSSTGIGGEGCQAVGGESTGATTDPDNLTPINRQDAAAGDVQDEITTIGPLPPTGGASVATGTSLALVLFGVLLLALRLATGWRGRM